MKKVAFVFLVALAALMAACSPDQIVWEQFELDAADKTPYAEKALPVMRDGAAAGEVRVRLYEDHPSIPYISAADFQALMLPGSTMSVTWIGDGQYLLENQYATATVDTRNEIFASDDYIRFTNLMELVQEGMDNVILDGVPFVRYASQNSTPPQPVSFDYGAYGIDLRGDGTAVYFPFTTLADLYCDLFQHNAACNGEKVVVADREGGDNSISSQDADFSVEKLLAGTRSEDMAAYSYAEFCFVIDHFYGQPGRSPYEASLMSMGLDKTLEATEAGKDIKKLLLSTSLADEAAGLDFMHIYLNDGGHSHPWKGGDYIMEDAPQYATAYPELLQLYADAYYISNFMKSAYIQGCLKPERQEIFPDGATYHKKGDTAICHFDDFHFINYPAWRAFYAGTGPRPTLENISEPDQMAVFLDALEKADKDPEVKNLVLDLTLNTGGSSDLVVAMTSLMYGESLIRCVNPLTGERYEWYFDVDRNFDGKFDEKDKEVHYDLNFCVLTSRFCFSCGNYFPTLCRDKGILIVGEQSGGGSCGVAPYRTAEGFLYTISSARSRLSDKNWKNTDGGVAPDVAIELGPDHLGVFRGVPVVFPSFAKFYDLDYLSGIIHKAYDSATVD